MNIPSETLEKIPRAVSSWVTIEGKKYYVKKWRTRLGYSEVIADKIASMYGIRHASYTAVKVDNKLYFLSEDLEYLGNNLITSDVFKVKNASLYEYWHYFHRFFPRYEEKLINELVRVYLMDIIISNPDRNQGNWGILEEQGIPSIVIFDNELIMRGEETKISSYYMEKDNRNYMKKPNYSTHPPLEDLDNFLKESSEEYIIMFRKMLDKLTPDIFKSLLLSIESEYNDVVENMAWAIEEYQKHYAKLLEVLNRYLKEENKEAKLM